MYDPDIATVLTGRAIQDYVIAGSDDFEAVKDSIDYNCKMFGLEPSDYKPLVVANCRMIIGLVAKKRSEADVAILQKIIEERKIGDVRKMMNKNKDK